MSHQLFVKVSGQWGIRVAVVGALMLLGIGVMVVRHWSSPDDPTIENAVIDAPDPAISALGRIEPEGGMIIIAPPASGFVSRVAELRVEEGDTVTVNQILAEMDTRDRLQSAVLQAQTEVMAAESRLAQVQAGAKPSDIQAEQANVSRLQAELRNAQRDYERYLMLYRDGAIAEAELDDRWVQVESLTEQVAQAQQLLQSVSQVRDVDVQIAESELQVALANLTRAETELETAIVRSPINGQVIQIHADPGEQVGEDGILELGNTNQMIVVAEVYETDVRRVQVGQSATIRSAAFDGDLQGTVSQVGLVIDKNDVLDTDPTADTDARIVEVEIRLNSSQPVSGLTNLQVEVVIQP